MLKYSDPKWKKLDGGYKQPYNPTCALQKLEAAKEVDEVWEELWNELHHQGDLGLASYAAVPHLVRIGNLATERDWNLYSLISTIEIERHRKSNPIIPSWLESSYQDALKSLAVVAATDLIKTDDALKIRAILGFLALTKGMVKYGALISYFDEVEIEEYTDEVLAWSEIYR